MAKNCLLKNIKEVNYRGWILDIMNCLDRLNKKEFTLEELYRFEKALKELHPENNNIKPKIRQQLQFLRNKEYLEFLGNKKYKRK